VLELPERHLFRVVFDAVLGQLRRLDIEAFRKRGLRGIGCAVTDGAVDGVEVNAVGQVGVGRLQRVRKGRILAGHRRVQRMLRRPFFVRERFGIGAGRHRTELDARVHGPDEKRYRKHDAVDESAHNLILSLAPFDRLRATLNVPTSP